MKSSEKPHIVFLGQNGFPCGYAEIQKLRLLAKSLLHAGCKVTVINRLWILGQCPEGFEAEVSGRFEDIDYIFACGTPHRPPTFIKRNFKRLSAYFKEFYIIWKLSRKQVITGGFIAVNSFWDAIRYRIFSRLLSFPIVINIMEKRSEIVFGKNPLRHFDAWLSDRFVYHFVDGVFPISDFLASNIKRFAPQKPYLKVPILVDFSRYRDVPKERNEKYILFCGGLAYLNVIQFILNSFEHCVSDNIFLYLVVNGPSVLLSDLKNSISKLSKRQFIRVFSRLSDAELSKLYINSIALLIPLRSTVQDQARFPHKIGEYCASGRPLITTNYGEIHSYFIHKQTAFIAPEYDEKIYAKTIDEVLSNPGLADEVGMNAKQLCQKEFDYLLYGERIKKFIQSLRDKR